MNLLDAIILVLVLMLTVRGTRVGFFRQLGSLGGFLLGLIVGAEVATWAAKLVHGTTSKSVLALGILLFVALGLSTLGEILGQRAAHQFMRWRLGAADRIAGAGFGAVTALLAIWMVAAVLSRAPYGGVASELQGSWILRTLDAVLPPAPDVLAQVEPYVDPNGFPRVFAGLEPEPAAPVSGPNAALVNAAARAGTAATVRIEGEGCGGVVDGSGFVVASGLVATNAHVVAGIEHPVVIDSRGPHPATPVVFDPNLDFAVLRVSGLAAAPLPLATQDVDRGTVGAVLGYPGGGPFSVSSAAVLQRQIAIGRNIYDRGVVRRNVYELQAEVRPGNSGGPFITPDGKVEGVVFAASSTNGGIGYALTSSEILTEVNQAVNASQISTGACAVE